LGNRRYKGVTMLSGQQVFTVSTKKDKDSAARKTVLTVKWDGCSEQVCQALAVQALVVKLQGNWRAKGIPEKFEVSVKDHAPGTRHAEMTPEQIRAAVLEGAKADKAKRAELLAALMAMDDAEGEEAGEEIEGEGEPEEVQE
jgi:hypothetical protein